MDIEPVMLTIDMGPYDPPKALERRPLEKFAWFAHDCEFRCISGSLRDVPWLISCPLDHTIPTVYGRIHPEGKVCKREESVPFPYHNYMEYVSLSDPSRCVAEYWL